MNLTSYVQYSALHTYLTSWMSLHFGSLASFSTSEGAKSIFCDTRLTHKTHQDCDIFAHFSLNLLLSGNHQGMTVRFCHKVPTFGSIHLIINSDHVCSLTNAGAVQEQVHSYGDHTTLNSKSIQLMMWHLVANVSFTIIISICKQICKLFCKLYQFPQFVDLWLHIKSISVPVQWL